MKRTSILSLLALFLLFVSLSPVHSTYAPVVDPAGDPLPQQSTSGPLPLIGVGAPAAMPQSPATAVMISGVPAYSWHHGCGPTAAGMVIGYYDMHGYPWLIPGDSSTQTTAVSEAIASETTPSGTSSHYADYALPEDSYPTLLADRSAAPAGDEHASNSIADFMYTSFSSQGNYYGWSWSNHVGPAMSNYIKLKQPTAGVSYVNRAWSGSLWTQFQAEINANRPVVFLVDSDGNGGTDHFITGIGYDVVDGVNYYATWDTWSTLNVRWQPFIQMQNGKAWGIYQMTTLTLTDNPVPTIVSITPGSTYSGSGRGSITLQVSGLYFKNTSLVRWNGANLVTTYISPTQLSAVIPAANLANPGSQPITVFNTTPGGGTSDAVTFPILDFSVLTRRNYLPTLRK